MKMFPPEKISRRICPRHQYIVVEAPREELKAELVPLEPSPGIKTRARYLGGFESRIAPVTEAELKSMDVVRCTAATQGEVQS
jgi:hypothetical protein